MQEHEQLITIYELKSLKPKLHTRNEAEVLDVLDLTNKIEDIFKNFPNFSDKSTTDWTSFNNSLSELIYENNSPKDILRILLQYYDEPTIKYSLSANFLYALKHL